MKVENGLMDENGTIICVIAHEHLISLSCV